MDLFTRQALNDYFAEQRKQPLYNVADYGAQQVSNPTWASNTQSGAYTAQNPGQVSSSDHVASISSAANSIISAIATSALAAQQDKMERETFKKKSELENEIFGGNQEMKRKQHALNNRSAANRLTFDASDVGMKAASNQSALSLNAVNDIVNALARAYLTKG